MTAGGVGAGAAATTGSLAAADAIVSGTTGESAGLPRQMKNVVGTAARATIATAAITATGFLATAVGAGEAAGGGAGAAADGVAGTDGLMLDAGVRSVC